jgi:hypothetical protein
MHVPLTVAMDEFRITDVLVSEEMCVLVGHVNGNPDAIPPFFLGIVDGEFEPPRRQYGILVVFDGDTVVAENDWLFGVFAWILVRPGFPRLLFSGGVEIRVVVTVYGILERSVFAFNESSFPFGERVEFDSNGCGDIAFHRYCPVCASMYSSMV